MVQDDQMIERARAGDEHAFRFLVEKYKNYLFKADFLVFFLFFLFYKKLIKPSQ